MVDRMREQPDGHTVAVTMGDISRVTTGRTYGLGYRVYNAIGHLLTQDCQGELKKGSAANGMKLGRTLD
jgi:hypothetical protein